MRIAQLVKTPQRRGAEVFALDLCRELEQRGNETAIFYLYPHDGPAPLPVRPQDQVLGERFRPTSLLERIPGAQPALVRRLLRSLDAFAPDVVQVNGSRSVKYGSIARRLRAGRWPLIARIIGSPPDWAGSSLKRLLYGRLVLSAVDGVIAVSRDTLEGLRSSYGLDLPFAVIPRGVTVGPFRGQEAKELLRRSRGVRPDTPVIAYVGSLTTEKRLDRLLRVFARVRLECPRAILWIAGGGPLETDLRREVQALQLDDCVDLLGVVEDVDDLLHAADLLLLTSDTEGTPGVVLEAGAAALPVVATRVGGLSACVLHEQTGVLVDPGDVPSLAAATATLLLDADRRRALGLAARRWIEKTFSLPTIADDVLAFYSECLTRSSDVRSRSGA